MIPMHFSFALFALFFGDGGLRRFKNFAVTATISQNNYTFVYYCHSKKKNQNTWSVFVGNGRNMIIM